MDFILLVVIIIFAILLIGFYFINRITKTTDGNNIFATIALEKPSTVAFSLGYNKNLKKFQNVARNQTTNSLEIKLDDNPVGLDGSYIIQRAVGDVKENVESYGVDGYTIEGFPTKKFTCPEGYHGLNCRLNDICSGPSDVGKYKPLSFDQFNDLAVYEMKNTNFKPIGEPKWKKANDAFHPRIRIYCVSDREYELEVCPENKLLDMATLNCKLYDVCHDRINGSKHVYQIDNLVTLKPNQYYLCDNNTSVLTQCPIDMTFSVENSTCLVESICSGKGRVTLPVDDNNYILCDRDFGTNIHCVNGVILSTVVEELMCKTSEECVPQLYEYDDGELKFNYGRVKCLDDGTPITEFCTTEIGSYGYDFEWKEQASYDIYNYPDAVLNPETNLCEPSSIGKILQNPQISLAWTSAMNQEHPFNIVTGQYICDDENAYRWDYDANDTVPPSNGKMFFTGAPCQTTELSITLPYRTLPPNKPFIVIGYLVYIHLRIEPLYLWPVYDETAELYYYTRVDYNEERTELIALSMSSIVPPEGFTYTTDKNEEDLNGETVLQINNYPTLHLNGFGKAPTPLDRQYRYITSGIELTSANMYNPQVMTEQKIPVLGVVSTTDDLIFTIDWNKVLQSTIVIDKLIITNKTVTIDDITYDAGLTTFRIEKSSTFTKIHYMETSISFDNTTTPQLIFYTT